MPTRASIGALRTRYSGGASDAPHARSTSSAAGARPGAAARLTTTGPGNDARAEAARAAAADAQQVTMRWDATASDSEEGKDDGGQQSAFAAADAQQMTMRWDATASDSEDEGGGGRCDNLSKEMSHAPNGHGAWPGVVTAHAAAAPRAQQAAPAGEVLRTYGSAESSAGSSERSGSGAGECRLPLRPSSGGARDLRQHPIPSAATCGLGVTAARARARGAHGKTPLVHASLIGPGTTLVGPDVAGRPSAAQVGGRCASPFAAASGAGLPQRGSQGVESAEAAPAAGGAAGGAGACDPAASEAFVFHTAHGSQSAASAVSVAPDADGAAANFWAAAAKNPHRSSGR